MIIPIIGNVTYSITLDPSVWIFDERKVLLDDAFREQTTQNEKSNEEEFTKKLADRFNREVYQSNAKVPRVNKGLTKKEGEEILKNTYVMPLSDFIENAEIKDEAKKATFITESGEETISIQDLKDGYFLFSINGKVIKDQGPVHFYFKDGSNKENPIKGIQKINIQ